MKIIKLQSANFKRLKAIEIIPKGNTVIVSGKNGQGKSSILDSIFVALAGKDKDLLKPIREGETKAEIMVETETYFIKRIFRQGRTELEVISKDGEVISKPQTFLDGLVGKLSFDPLEFASLKGPDQREMLLKLTGLNLSEIEKSRKDAYDNRHEIGAMMKAYPEKMVGEIAEAEMEAKKEKINAQALVVQINQIKDREQENTRLHDKMVQLSSGIHEAQEEIKRLETKISRYQNEQETTLASVIINIPSPAPLEAQLQNSYAHNATVDAAVRILEENSKRTKLQAEYDACTAKIESFDVEKDLQLQNAKMPIEGLYVTDDAVTYNKIPFHQLSSAEKLKVSMAIAMAMNPELRVIRIMDGSLLDEDNMKIIQEMANREDMQVWVEVVDSSGKLGFYIEDGEVVAEN